jgi:AraC-like DNA-binding protein
MAIPITHLSASSFDPKPLAPVMREIERIRLLAEAPREGISKREKAAQCIEFLELAIRRSPTLDVTLSDLACLLNLERTYCSRFFRTITGKSFSNWIREIRISLAREFLLFGRHSITQVSLTVGYSDITTFERNFRKETGMSPTSFRRREGKLLAGNHDAPLSVSRRSGSDLEAKRDIGQPLHASSDVGVSRRRIVSTIQVFTKTREVP